MPNTRRFDVFQRAVIFLNETNQMNQINETNQINQTNETDQTNQPILGRCRDEPS